VEIMLLTQPYEDSPMGSWDDVGGANAVGPGLRPWWRHGGTVLKRDARCGSWAVRQTRGSGSSGGIGFDFSGITPPCSHSIFPIRIYGIIDIQLANLSGRSTIHLVGHSWGGDTAAQAVARYGEGGRQVETLVTIDPVGMGATLSFFGRVRAGARQWFNVNATGGGSFERSNFMAGLGDSWDERPRRFAHTFINAPHRHGSFNDMMKHRVGSDRSAEDVVLDRNTEDMDSR
jgi:pimeloyl-ACP methyl ester carboxylesterase